MDPNQQPQNVNNPAQPEQPQVVTQPPNQGYQQPAPVAENPGQTMGIISIVLTFLGLGFVGIILGIISRNKSKQANAPTTLGTIGLVFGIVSTVFSLLITIAIFIVAFVGVQQRANSDTDYQRQSPTYEDRQPSADSSSDL